MAFDKFGRGEDLDVWTRKIQDIMDEMLNRSYVHYRDSGVWQPATNIYETPDAYIVCIELAGMEQEGIELHCVDRRRLVVRGRRCQPRPEGCAAALSVHVMEIDEGAFEREIDLPEPIEMNAIAATYNKGFLWVTLPRIPRT